jgi:hypothetical protein
LCGQCCQCLFCVANVASACFFVLCLVWPFVASTSACFLSRGQCCQYQCLLFCPVSCVANVDSAWFFSSPDPKGHVRYCHHLAVRRPSVNFSYFNLLLWNNWTKWNQTWQKASI